MCVDVVYDLGCGEGDVVCSIAERFFTDDECPSKVVGFDILDRPLAQARVQWENKQRDRMNDHQFRSVQWPFGWGSSSTNGNGKRVAVEFCRFDFIDDDMGPQMRNGRHHSNWLDDATVIYAYLTPKYLNKRKLVKKLLDWLVLQGKSVEPNDIYSIEFVLICQRTEGLSPICILSLHSKILAQSI